jgi:hypothetical protein
MRYRIVLRGNIDGRLLERLEEATLVPASPSDIALECDIVDQARLHAVLRWLYETGMDLVSVEPVDNDSVG